MAQLVIIRGVAVDVHVVVLDVAPDLVAAACAVLSDEERERAARYRFRRDHDRYAVAHAAVRDVLGAHLGAPASALDLSATARDGKPEPLAGLHWSLSHSEDLAVIATTTAGPVGVDVERVRAFADAGSIVATFFAPAERAALDGVETTRWLDAFFACWTGKEAVLKASGDGLRRPPEEVVVPVEPVAGLGRPVVLPRGGRTGREGRRWSEGVGAETFWLASFDPAPGYAGAIAVPAGRACLAAAGRADA